MPKVEIDYSNTIIYKITCKDPSLTDVYVGHTTNFVQRKHAHKELCKNDKSSNHNYKLYKVIRDNGGWQNWIMEIVIFVNCHDHYEARKKEHEYCTLLKATLNSIEPMPKPKEKNVVIKCNLNSKPTCDVCNKTVNNETTSNQTENQELKNYVCVCSKEYNQTLDMNLMMQLLKQNNEIKSVMVEQNTMLRTIIQNHKKDSQEGHN